MQEFLSDFIGKPLLTRSGERIGYVRNVQTDKKLTKIRNLECCDDEEEEFLLPLSALASFDKDAAVVKSPAAVPCKDCIPAPFGMPVYAEDGALLGYADDFEREGKQITALLLSDRSRRPVGEIAAVSDTVFLGSPGKKRSAARPAPRKRAQPSAEPAAEKTFVSSFSENQTASTAAAAAPSGTENLSEQKNGGIPLAPPSSRQAGSGLLTGKTLPSDLKDARGNIIACAGSKVSAQTIRKAMDHGKLFELTLLCCGNFYLQR